MWMNDKGIMQTYINISFNGYLKLNYSILNNKFNIKY
jgi:hypothetical protein